MPASMENICLKHDNGEDLRFHGRLFSECSHFDEDTGGITRQQLYVTDSGEQVYYIVQSDGRGSQGRRDNKRRAYRLSVKEDNCVINNGKAEITLEFDMLMLAVRALCGLDAGATPSLETVEEILKAINA